MNVAADRSTIADLSLAPQGRDAIAWASRYSPVLNGLLRSELADGSFDGLRVALVVHLEAKTAFLATILADAGAEVVVAGSNPHSTRDEISAALVDMGIEVHSSHATSYEQWETDLLAVADTEPSYIIDDGAELTVRMAKHRPELYAKLQGVSEETTTGVARLRSLETAGRLPFAAMAANDAACKHMFDNRYGTGQSTVQAILALTNFLMANKRVTVIGYGWVGRGIANYARAMGARTAVVEVDPIRALDAHMEGHQVAPLAVALADSDLVITATGGMRAIGSRDFEHVKPNAVLANAGHHDLEIDVDALRAESNGVHVVRDGVTRFNWGGGTAINVLSAGALVNIAGGLGHPIEIMDLSFAVQGLSSHELVVGDYEPGVHVLPRRLDEAIARARLAADGVEVDALAGDQHDDIDRWLEVGS